MKKITIIGLGAGDLEQMPLGVYRHLKEQNKVYVRTNDHPAVSELINEGVNFESFDEVYEQHDDFESVYNEIVQILVDKAEGEAITYAVPGHPLVAERTIQLLLSRSEQKELELVFLGGQSFLDAMYTSLRIDPIEGCQIVDGTALRRDDLTLNQHIIIVQVYDAMIASDVKLTLMERLPDDYEVTIATAVGSKEEQLTRVPLFELDRVTTLNNLTAVYVPPVQEEELLYGEFAKLREVIATLRGPGGCPWDQKQTHQSLKKYLLEEAYEVLEAIDEEDDEHLIEELGDILLQVMLHAQIGEDEGFFSVRDVIEGVTGKMIRRHPHVFGELTVNDADEVVTNWDDIKKQEKGNTDDDSVLATIPKGLPALLEATKLQKKAAKVGFDWEDAAPIWMKLQEEIGEFMLEVKVNSEENMHKEFGDILFVLVNLARYYKIDAEDALLSTNRKFMRRFRYIEETSRQEGKILTEMTLSELDQKWEQAKQLEQ
ncbi:nucleoside triphosphate pyrophosphohydrolase [Halalkalibacter nanhaiisediminis]|uniref:Tetrapyrrole methylase family protein/MazG family protein n=1 Tax=Halalkalibacter nanhaiisediminis TaxID=688079 RepID=A0A562Q8Z4_9BACI|nr:nucleoside triphosphate pyrophosphohydrolase [Halalkalibacter nanhaiisediminis]TWI53222.1 tetrapyrrole methylase family protein/MazG family protein [Halalkalibacter nanhaiisediminis]